MLSAFITFAAEAAGHEETDKTLFYLAGGLLTAWALLVSAIGITRHDFPSTEGAARGVYALSTVFVLFALTATILTN